MTKTTGKMIPTIDIEIYTNLLKETLPKIIETETEYQSILQRVEHLTFKQNKTIEELNLLKLLVLLIEDYEKENYPLTKVKPHEILLHLMDSNNINQADLLGIISSKEAISEVMNGKQQISLNQAKALAKFFNVSVELFI